MTTEEKRLIERHGKNLLVIYPESTEKNPLVLCKKLRRLEVKANALATMHCNGETKSEESFILEQEKILTKLIILLLPINSDSIPFFNEDCRGYALKIEDEAMRRRGWELQTDLGGYGIIAPDLTS